jgi:hypothetical protein
LEKVTLNEVVSEIAAGKREGKIVKREREGERERCRFRKKKARLSWLFLGDNMSKKYI